MDTNFWGTFEVSSMLLDTNKSATHLQISHPFENRNAQENFNVSKDHLSFFSILNYKVKYSILKN